MRRAEALSIFLDALDEWGCEDNASKATEIIAFLDGGCDLSMYRDRPSFQVIQGALARQKEGGE
jgi:hypothetical protein